MTMRHDRRPNPASSKERGTGTLGRSGILHLAVCLGLGVTVVIALSLIG